MVGIYPAIMDIDTYIASISDIFSNDKEKCLAALIRLKSSLIGSNRAKDRLIEIGLVPQLIDLLTDEEDNSGPSDDRCAGDVKVAVAYAFGSLAKGSDHHMKVLLESRLVDVLLDIVASSTRPRFVEASLCCLRTLFSHPDAPIDLLHSDASLMSHLLAIMPLSTSNQISVATILMHACKTRDHQLTLTSRGVVDGINALLASPYADVQLPALQSLAVLVYGNESVASVVVASVINAGGRPLALIDAVVNLMERDRPVEMQLAAARLVAYLFRGRVLSDNDPRVVYKALPTVVRLTKKEHSVDTRIAAADTLAYLIESNADLQRVASISNHLIPTIASFLWWESDSASVELTGASAGLTRTRLEQGMCRREPASNLSKEMKRSAFRVFSALAASGEDIRKRIIDTDKLVGLLVSSLKEPENFKLQMAAVGCLHSLSRSVQLLRTSFQDYPVWKPLVDMLASPLSSVDCLVVASSTLCNLLLDFSPSKEPILDNGAIQLLCQLTHKFEPALRLNGVWGLMNMAFQSDQRVKLQILTALGPDQIFRLLSDADVNVLMKTLGLLRNVVSHKNQIDHIMELYGKQIMQAVVLVLESNSSADVKEQAICILANIADGDTAKEEIMSNEDVLKKVTDYMMHTNVRLQTAAVVCVHNLAYVEEPGAHERQARLREVGVEEILAQLVESPDLDLAEKVKAAQIQFE